MWEVVAKAQHTSVSTKGRRLASKFTLGAQFFSLICLRSLSLVAWHAHMEPFKKWRLVRIPLRPIENTAS